MNNPTELTRTFWASIDPPEGEDRADATLWAVFLNLTVDEDAEDDGRYCSEKFVLTTTRRGWAAFDEFDEALHDRGYIRSSPWENGSGRGFVAWIEPNEFALLDSAGDE